ncbi:MAG: DNA replication/repair protein RecF [Bacteroidales bacterium]
MHLINLSINNFKNYEDAQAVFCPKINCFVGNNGCGKTNLLDAIHYLSFSKSYFNSSDTQNIRYEQSFFALHGNYETENGEVSVSCIQKRNQRKIFKLNKKEYDRISEHIGKFPLIMVAPQDQELINGSSEIRRKFLDSVISQFNRPYLEKLIHYNRVLEQRNRLLKQDYIDPSLLDVFDDQLTSYAYFLYQARKQFVDRFIPIFQQYYQEIAGTKEKINLQYISQIKDSDSMGILLKESIKKDQILQYTTVGIHKDDLALLLEEYPIKKVGSQGQQKSFIIALRLAQLQYISEQKKFFPILLLDDIFDKLDKQRACKLMNLVGQSHFGQVFLSDTDMERVENIFKLFPSEHLIYKISDAEIQKTTL